MANDFTLPRRSRMADEIIESLRQEIVSGKLPDGGRMPTEKDLAARYGVSQPTIREAMRSLETLGLVEVHHGSGSYVRGQGNYALALALQTLLQLESVGILEVLDVRQLLGRRSIELAAVRATAEDITAIRASIDAFDHIDNVNDVDGITQMLVAFQRAVSTAAHSPLLNSLETFLITLLIEVQVKSLKKKGVRFWRPRALEFKDDRMAIYQGVHDRSVEAAGAAMERYFEHQRARFVEDESLRELKLSDPRLITAVAQMVQQLRA